MSLVPFTDFPVNGQTALDNAFTNPAVAPTPYVPPPTFAATVAAEFRDNNTVVSFLSNKTTGMDNYDDGTFQPGEYLKEHRMEQHLPRFDGIMNRPLADAMRAQITQEEENRQVRDNSGWVGGLMGMVAGVADVPILIPGGAVVRNTTGGFAVLRSAMLTGAAAVAGAAVQEGVLHATQETRSIGESTFNVAGAAVLGSLFGGTLAAMMSRVELRAAEAGLKRHTAHQTGEVPNVVEPLAEVEARTLAGLSADVASGGDDYVDVFRAAPRTREDIVPEGTVASALAKATAWVNPVMRATQRYSTVAADTALNIFERTVYSPGHNVRAGNMSAETLIRTRVQTAQRIAHDAGEEAYAAMRTAGIRISRDDFYEQVAYAARRDDQHENIYVAQAAKAQRKQRETFVKEALELKILDPKEMDVKTAESYLNRIYDREKIIRDEPNFLKRISGWLRGQMDEDYAADVSLAQSRQQKTRERMADTEATGADRAARAADIKKQAKELDDSRSPFDAAATAYDDAMQARAAAKTEAERQAAKLAREQALRDGGAELEAYIKRRADLRRRRRDLGDNPEAMAERADKLQEKIEKVSETAETTIVRFAQTFRKLLDKLERASDNVARKAVDVEKLEAHATRVRGAIDKARKEVAKRLGSGDDAAAAQMIAKLDAYDDRLAQIMRRADTADELAENAAEVAQMLDGMLDEATRGIAERSVRRGERLAAMKARAEALSPEAIKARTDAKIARLQEADKRAYKTFSDKWGDEAYFHATGSDGRPPDFDDLTNKTARHILDTITGRLPEKDEVPAFVTKIATGPLRARTFLIPDNMIEEWLVNDSRVLFNRYTRSLAGEIELTRRFGKADMIDQITAIGDDYSKIRDAVNAATDIDGLNKAIGRDKYRAGKDFEKARRELLDILHNDQNSALKDVRAGRDLIRGDYQVKGRWSQNFERISRLAANFNYVRAMGGGSLSSLGETYRPAIVHGLKAYTAHVPGLVQYLTTGAGPEWAGKLANENKLLGIAAERALSAHMAASGDMMDPFVSNVTSIERFMTKATQVASTWNGMALLTDFQQSVAGTLTQARILRGIMEGTEDRYLNFLNIPASTQQDIAALFATHGQTIQGVRVPNTEEWTKGLTGNALRYAEDAVRIYRAAVNMDVNSIIARRGLGDAPLSANTPWGRLLYQFSGFAFGAHQRVMLRGMQEGPKQFAHALTTMTTMGMMTAYLASLRNGEERHKKFMDSITKNPSILIAEGVDRSGMFPLMFDFANRFERFSSALGADYRTNPIKRPATALFGPSPGSLSTRAADGNAMFSMLGPTAGMADSAVAATRVLLDLSRGKTPPKSDQTQAIAIAPYHSYLFMREGLQMLRGDSALYNP